MASTYIPGFTPALQSQPAAQPVQTATLAGEEVDPYTGLTKAQTDAQIAALLGGSVDIGNPGIVPEWEQYRAPSYSAPTMEYLSNLDKYIAQNDPSFGMMYSKAPTVDLSTPEKIRQYSLYGIGDFLPEEQVAAYASKPFEQNVGFTVAPTEVGVGKNVTGALDVGYNTPIILRDDATGEIVYQGTGFAGAQEAARLSNQMSATGDKKTQWSLLTGDPGATDISQFNVVAQDKPDYLGGVLGALVQYGLPIGLSLIPGVGWAGSAALAGAGSTAGKLISGYDLDDALKAGLITAGTAGLLKAPILGGGGSIGGTIGSALESVPGVGDALRGVSDAFAGGGSNAGAQAAADALANEIVVTGIKSATPALISGAAGSLLGSAALNNVLGNTLVNTPIEQAVNQTPQTLEEQFDDILVKGGRLPTNAGAAVSGAAPAVVGNLPGAPQGPLSQEPVTQEQPTETANENEIVVTAKPTPIDLGGLPGSVISNLPPSLGTDLPGAQGPLSQEMPADTAEEGWEVKGKTETPLPATSPASTGNGSTYDQVANEIVVTKTPPPKTLDELASGALSNLPSSLLNDLPGATQGPLSQEAPANTAEEGWEVKGKTETPLPATPPPGGYTSGYDPITNTITAAAEKPKPIGDALAAAGAAVPPLNSVDIPANAGDVQPVDKKSDLDKIIDYLRLAGLGISTIGSLFGKGGDGGTPISVGRGSLNPVFSAQLPSANLPGLTGGATGPRPASALPQTTQDWYRYGYGPEQSFFNYVPQTAANTSQAYTGYAVGGYAVGGPGDGRDDKIPAMLSDGEYVIDAETVAMLGNGSSKAGAEALDNFRVNVRKHKGRQLAKGQFSVKAKKPEQYLKGRK